jgi:hypothetical protein
VDSHNRWVGITSPGFDRINLDERSNDVPNAEVPNADEGRSNSMVGKFTEKICVGQLDF